MGMELEETIPQLFLNPLGKGRLHLGPVLSPLAVRS